jgi:hypothetical protein
MNVTKTLMLAAVSALSIGVGAAFAQSAEPSGLEYMSSTPKAIQAPAAKVGVQAGSSDVERGNHTLPFDQDYGTLANPG